ncbi:hypothetical protein PYCCODRAFT_1014738 [Trametes coccinea BRFM310]|uniref:Uncharacterized protein n=1 Tax=Trametes coccinea (strain BRFM310) TaxID=1353009 RepID=A0A1Y2IAT2_TRAC3|nr:hypothetical protein PYCCODRAFT_1014738 [Trametes coccinea BRFM310]
MYGRLLFELGRVRLCPPTLLAKTDIVQFTPYIAQPARRPSPPRRTWNHICTGHSCPSNPSLECPRATSHPIQRRAQIRHKTQRTTRPSRAPKYLPRSSDDTGRPVNAPRSVTSDLRARRQAGKQAGKRYWHFAGTARLGRSQAAAHHPARARARAGRLTLTCLPARSRGTYCTYVLLSGCGAGAHAVAWGERTGVCVHDGLTCAKHCQCTSTP